jgi:hypothetical protein
MVTKIEGAMGAMSILVEPSSYHSLNRPFGDPFTSGSIRRWSDEYLMDKLRSLLEQGILSRDDFIVLMEGFGERSIKAFTFYLLDEPMSLDRVGQLLNPAISGTSAARLVHVTARRIRYRLRQTAYVATGKLHRSWLQRFLVDFEQQEEFVAVSVLVLKCVATFLAGYEGSLGDFLARYTDEELNRLLGLKLRVDHIERLKRVAAIEPPGWVEMLWEKIP